MESLIARFGLALAIGLLVGLERGWRERDDPPGSRTAGFRTFGLIGLLGGVFAALAEALDSAPILAAGFLGFAAIFAWYRAREALREESFSVTTVVAGLGVFALGALSVSGDYRAAAAGGAALAAVLASRELLHGLLQRMTWVELRSALVLVVMTAIGLPLLPDRALDPWGGFNPFEIWLFTVIVAAISYLGYIAVRVLGQSRGLLVSGITGALVSSTAVTVAFARHAREGSNAVALSGAASFAAMVSILRVSAIVLLLKPEVLLTLGLPAFAAAAIFAGCGFLLVSRDDGDGPGESAVRNPFDLGPLAIFALSFAVVSTVSAALGGRFGGGGVVATSAVSGAFDVDVAVLSALRMSDGAVGVDVVGQAVLAALASNALVRLALATAAGPLRYSIPLAGATLLALAAGAAVFWLMPSF